MAFKAVNDLLSKIDDIFANNATEIEIEPILNQTRIKINESDAAIGALKKLDIADSTSDDMQSLIIGAYRELVQSRENLIQIFNHIKQYPERLVDRASIDAAQESIHKYVDDLQTQYAKYKELADHTTKAEQRSALQNLIDESGFSKSVSK